jgi:hypothetical protein
MRKVNALELSEVEIINEKTIVYHYSFTGNIQNYLNFDTFYIKYDKPIVDVPESILTIPFVTSMAIISWLTDTEIRVNTLDRKYAESLEKMKNVYQRFYPLMPIQGSINVTHVRNNSFNNKKMGMLFSGGLDSTTLYIQNRHLKPELFTIFGAGIPVSNRKMIMKIKKAFPRFVKQDGVKVSFIETNIREVLNEALLSSIFGKFLQRDRANSSWWQNVNHGPILLSMCAPLSIDGTSRVMLASTPAMVPDGSHPSLIGVLKWADIEVLPQGFEYDRRQKVRKVLKPFIYETHQYPPLQLCNYAPVVSDHFNCGSCEKCVNIILELILARINPRKCCFPLIRDFYNNIRKNVVKDIAIPKYWLNFQQEVHTIKAFAKAEDFLKWINEEDFTLIRTRPLLELSMRWAVLLLYSKLPRRVQMDILRKFYYHRYLEKDNARASNASRLIL